MNSILNSNLEKFRNRFPKLAEILPFELSGSIEILQAKNGSPTATFNSIPLHSKYNPEREAETQASAFDDSKSEAAFFLGFGLGHTLNAFARKFPKIPMVIFEKDAARFFTALSVLDWSSVFEHQNLILAIGAEAEEYAPLIAKFKAESIHCFRTKSQTAHAENFFDSIEKSIKQNISKEEINTNTLEKFAGLWLSNSLRNLEETSRLDGVRKFAGLGKGIPFTVIAAGPSLEKILPFMEEIKKRSVVVCVDTALHAMLRTGVQPDFIILADPQFYCAMHLEFLRAPASVLVTETGAYPSVFRFDCREKVLFSSQFPVGRYFESRTGEKGPLAAGGSVSTTSWDFCLLCGATEIFMAGMDLGFPARQTHIRGSQFEEKAHFESSRTSPAEGKNMASLFGANPVFEKDFEGKDILSDKRMKLFSWWFDTHCTEARKQGTRTHSLTKDSLRIQGMDYIPPEEFLGLPDISDKKEEFFTKAAEASKAIKESEKNLMPFSQVLEEFRKNLSELQALAKKGISISQKAISDRTKRQKAAADLNEIDRRILESECKDAASLVFPTPRQIQKLSESITEPDKELYSFRFSMMVYKSLFESVKKFEKFL